MAVNNDPDALKSLIKHLERKYEIGRILYLYQKELAKKLNEVKPLSSVLMPIEVAVKNPTVHKDIYSTIKGLIIPQLANIMAAHNKSAVNFMLLIITFLFFYVCYYYVY